jgi:hypothetical protein
MLPSAIFVDLRETYGGISPELVTVRKWVMKIKAGTFSIFPESPTGRQPKGEITQQLMKTLQTHPQASTPMLAEIVGVSRHTVKNRLIYELGMKKVSLRWVPYSLTPSQLESRKEGAKQLAQVISQAKKLSYSNLLTGDETWIYFQNSPLSVWVPKSTPRPTCARQTISSAKVLVTVFFSGQKVFHLSVLSQHQTMNSERFISTVLHPLQETINKEDPHLPFPVLLHYDNAPCHNSKMTKDSLCCSVFQRVKAPPYSPDISPCDFYLFGTLKAHLKGKVFRDEKEVEKEIADFLKTISTETLCKVFDEWQRRCEQVGNDGEYID